MVHRDIDIKRTTIEYTETGSSDPQGNGYGDIGATSEGAGVWALKITDSIVDSERKR